MKYFGNYKIFKVNRKILGKEETHYLVCVKNLWLFRIMFFWVPGMTTQKYSLVKKYDNLEDAKYQLALQQNRYKEDIEIL